MTSTLISCIIPVYNGERYLTEAIDSVERQTKRVLEIIVVDDGSTDGTADIAASYGPRVKYVYQSNRGIAAARNLGLHVARGNLVAFLDADDLWHPEKLEKQVAHFTACNRLEISVTLIQNFWIPELKAEAERFRDHRFSRPLPGYVPQTLLAPRTVFTTIGRFNEDCRGGSDLEWFIRAKDAGAVIELLPDVLVYRRLHKNNVSRTASSQTDIIRVIKMSLDQRRNESNNGAQANALRPQRPPTIIGASKSPVWKQR